MRHRKLTAADWDPGPIRERMLAALKREVRMTPHDLHKHLRSFGGSSSIDRLRVILDLRKEGLITKDEDGLLRLDDWPTDGTCRRCSSVPRDPKTGLCATCTDEDASGPW